MGVFGSEWWDERSLYDGEVRTEEEELQWPRRMWSRWRLLDELLARFYVDFGLEPAFGYIGVEHYQVALWSPHCRRAPRFFGRLCGFHFHSHDDTDIIDYVGAGVRYAGLNPTHDVDERTVWPSWSAYLQDAIETLGLPKAGVSGHGGCFHRRGKSLLPTMYRVALLLRTSGSDWHDVTFEDPRRLLSYPPLRDVEEADQGEVERVIRASGGTPSQGPIAAYFVVLRHDRYVAVRTDGWIATPSGALDAAAMWRSGLNEVEISDAVSTLFE